MPNSYQNPSVLAQARWSGKNSARPATAVSKRTFGNKSANGPQDDHRRKWLVGGLGLLAVVFLFVMVWRMLPPPQMKTDEEVFKTVDALFTAVTSRDPVRLEECEKRLATYRAEGRTSEAVATKLDGIVKEARGGEWKPAAKKLYTFIMGQRGKK